MFLTAVGPLWIYQRFIMNDSPPASIKTVQIGGDLFDA